MRLGAPVSIAPADPVEWVRVLKANGYSAAYCPIDFDAPEELKRAFKRAAEQTGIVIAEVGAWSNLISTDDEERKNAIAYCKSQLQLADDIGAVCCVNITGSRGTRWDGPHPDNFSSHVLELIVDTVREILFEVQPRQSFFTLEAMPWSIPDSADSYLELIHSMNHPHFAAHLDPVNLISSPRLFYENSAVIRDFVERLGPFIKSCHAKDIALSNRLTVHLDEVVPGRGGLDYATFLRGIDRLHPDTPIMLEHLSTQREYEEAGAYVRHVARDIGATIREPE